jgi:hypothetical protein
MGYLFAAEDLVDLSTTAIDELVVSLTAADVTTANVPDNKM